jgi:hypothetical protein
MIEVLDQAPDESEVHFGLDPQEEMIGRDEEGDEVAVLEGVRLRLRLMLHRFITGKVSSPRTAYLPAQFFSSHMIAITTSNSIRVKPVRFIVDTS